MSAARRLTMRAKPGDWLIVESRADNRHAREAEVLEVHGVNGAAPYLVRWLDDGREVLLFPGPDGQIMTAVQLADRDRIRGERIGRLQAEISDGHPESSATEPR
jgi:hypothetical protein